MIFGLQEKMASEITLSEKPGLTIRKWREIFGIKQHELADWLKLNASVISDYEHDRRQSPGLHIIRKLIQGMISIDKSRGSPTIKKYSSPEIEAIIDIREFIIGKSITEFAKLIDASILTSNGPESRLIYGYTIIDSLKAILTFSAEEYLKIFGWNSDRALIFTGVKYGRSPMIAVRTHTLKPAVIVFHQPEKIDPLAVKLAELENITFLETEMPLKKILSKLQKI